MDDLRSKPSAALDMPPSASNPPLIYQYCEKCGRAQLPLAGVCIHCRSRNLVSRISGGQGAIYSLTTVHRAPTAAFEAAVPYTLILVDLDEGHRLMTNLLGAGRNSAAIGDRVQVRTNTALTGPAPTYALLIARGAA